MGEGKNKTNNKGFSLVELIIVIAIMAILVGLIAPQFVKYVQQSKEVSEAQNIEILQAAANTVLADITFKGGGAGDFSIPQSGEPSDGIKGNFKALLEAALGQDENGKIKYPRPRDSAKRYVITVTGDTTVGYSATVELK